MKPDERFLRQPKSFWAYVRSISEAVGYTDRETHNIKVPKLSELRFSLEKVELNPAIVVDTSGRCS
ncbi:MAG: hypothetical protein M1282_01610, partial [Chloroflexi bacterium]|nr:hypothetical protein [Chloroflexota bacterium]